ncbi:MAG: serine/threonine protein kinase, partial [Thermoanaerobaculia bacterium]|nr:serine/threonine protein kinase [Thermoanaerobaculia bacterium]
MGQVYEAVDQELDQSVALKLIRPELAVHPGMMDRFKSEIRLARQVTHPNVCRIFDFFLHRQGSTSLAFLTMELVRGQSLAQLLRQREALQPPTALPILRQVVSALAAAHDVGIVHGDLKPGNIMVAASDNSEDIKSPRAVVTDFGMAIALDAAHRTALEALDEPGQRILAHGGTPAYMAPEQLVGAHATPASDLFAFGLVAYEVLKGVRPEVPEPESAGVDPVTRFDRVSGLAPDVATMLQECLEHRPERRPEAGHLLDSLSGGSRLYAFVACRPAPDRDHSEGVDPIVGPTADRPPLFAFDHPRDAIRWCLATARQHVEARQEPPAFAVHLGELDRRTRDKRSWPIAPEVRQLLVALLAMASGSQVLLSRSAFETTRQAGRGGDNDVQAEQHPDPEGLQWLAHGIFQAGASSEPCEVFGVADGEFTSAEPPTESAEVRRLAQLGTILGWRPGVGLALPHRPHWRIVRKLGEGGFGEAWLARHDKTSEERVWKFCCDAERLAALQREITLFRLLRQELGDRDDINRVLDWNLESPPYFIETEYTAGGDLLAWCRKQGGLRSVPRATLLELLAQVGDALAAAHSIGVLHKDVKPTNVLIDDGPGGPRVRLADFGVGHALDRQRLDSAGITVLGLTEPSPLNAGAATEIYAAPELKEGKTPKVQADVYAMGVMLYQIAVGDFSRTLAPGWQRQIDDSLLVKDIEDAVDGDPDHRPGARDLASRLRHLDSRRDSLEQERELRTQVEASRRELIRSRSRRRVLVLVLVATTLVALTAAWVSYRISEEASRARDAAKLAVAVDWMDDGPTVAANVLLDMENPGPAAFSLMRRALNEPLARYERQWPIQIGTAALSPDGSRIAIANEALPQTDQRCWLRAGE